MNNNIINKIANLHRANIIDEELEKYYFYRGDPGTRGFSTVYGVLISEDGNRYEMFQEIKQRHSTVIIPVLNILMPSNIQSLEDLETMGYISVIKLKDLIQNK